MTNFDLFEIGAKPYSYSSPNGYPNNNGNFGMINSNDVAFNFNNENQMFRVHIYEIAYNWYMLSRGKKNLKAPHYIKYYEESGKLLLLIGNLKISDEIGERMYNICSVCYNWVVDALRFSGFTSEGLKNLNQGRFNKYDRSDYIGIGPTNTFNGIGTEYSNENRNIIPIPPNSYLSSDVIKESSIFKVFSFFICLFGLF
jgi:hypothetical protein